MARTEAADSYSSDEPLMLKLLVGSGMSTSGRFAAGHPAVCPGSTHVSEIVVPKVFMGNRRRGRLSIQ